VIDQERAVLMRRMERRAAARRLVEKGVAFLSGFTVVAGFVKFNCEHGLHRRGIAEQQVDLLAAELFLVSGANES
jgi:hypothetical protein